MVGHAALGEVVGPYFLAPVAGADHRPPAGLHPRLVLLLAQVVQPRPQHFQRLGLVLVLGLLVLAGDDHAGRNVGDAHRRVGGVHALAAGPGRPVHVDADVLRVDHHVHFLDLGQDDHGRGGRVNAAAGLRDGHALDPVHAAFEFQDAERALAGHGKDDFLESAQARRVGVHQLPAPAPSLDVLGVHAEQVAREQGRFLAPGAGADLHDGVPFVFGIFRDEQAFQLGLGGDQRGAGLIELFLRHGAELRIGRIFQDVPVAVDLLQERPVDPGPFHERGQLAVLAVVGDGLVRLAEDVRVLKGLLDLPEPDFHAAAPGEQNVAVCGTHRLRLPCRSGSRKPVHADPDYCID